jgi:hypothetical protein
MSWAVSFLSENKSSDDQKVKSDEEEKEEGRNGLGESLHLCAPAEFENDQLPKAF